MNAKKSDLRTYNRCGHVFARDEDELREKLKSGNLVDKEVEPDET